MVERIVLTGAGGFVGRYLRDALSRRYPDAAMTCCGIVRSSGATPADVVLDIRDREAVDRLFEDTNPDLVIHLAAQSSVSRGSTDVDLTWSVNLSGSLNIALAVARHAPLATVLFVSTAEVYGASFLGGVVVESSPINPLSAYAKSKALAERMFADVLPSGTRLIIARPSNHTGAGQPDHFVLPSFAAQIARIERGDQEPRMLVGNVDVRRDFLDVRDVVQAYLALIDKAAALPPRFVANVSSGTPLLLSDLVDRLRTMARRPFEVVVEAARLRPVDVPATAADATLLRTTTGWAPTIAIDDTLAGVLQAARETAGRERDRGEIG